jgi:hypothetical protein
MDEHGSYCGWVGFSFRIERVKADELHPLSGPCAGKVQVLWRKGDIRMTAVRGGRDYNEYLDETIAYSLENIGLSKMGMETIEAPIVSVS